MKITGSRWLTCLIALCTLLELTNGAGQLYLSRRERNGYNIYGYAKFKSQSSSRTYVLHRGFRRKVPIQRENLIIDLPPLKSKITPGVIALAKIGRDKFAADRYAPVRVIKEEKNGRYIVRPVCDKKAPPAGVSDDYVHLEIPDSGMVSSSSYPERWYAPHYGRMYNKDDRYEWCTDKQDLKHPWLQIDLQALFYICSIKSTGSLNSMKTTTTLDKKNRYVITFTISVSSDGSKWEDVKENGKRKVFKRHSSPVQFHQPVGLVDKPYRHIRFHITSYQSWPCLGIEVFGYGEVIKHGLSYPLHELRLTGSVCNLYTLCEDTPHATCGSEGKIPGTYTCKCRSGFTGPKVFTAGDKVTCSDINECLKNPCGKYTASCTNNPGSYRCNCKKGFEHDNGDLTKCKDTDECLAVKSPCSPFARCENTKGSYVCRCNNGYYGDGYTCTDINECKPPDGSSGCQSHYADCTNSPGSYSCDCWKGYTGDGNICTDINECTAGVDPCSSINDKCVNNIGSYYCQCARGHKRIKGKCEDVDECKSPDLNDCNKHAACINRPGSYSCQCKTGFTGSGYDSLGCSDIDECQDKDKCGKNSECTNTVGSFSCRCKSGYASPSEADCLDIDECKTSSTCDRLATCVNLQGSYKCTCPDGWTGTGQPPTGCTALAWCEYKGKAICGQEFRHCDSELRKCTRCRSGFEEIGGRCKDINECDRKPCGDSSVCTNTVGSFTCRCKSGYHFDEKQKLCKDVDECNSVKRYCHDDAICENTAGSYDCNCKEGYDGDGFFCADVNECYTRDYKCPAHSVCFNLLGSYKCVCKKGYHRNGKRCTKGDSENPKDAPKGNVLSVYDKVSSLWNTASFQSLPSFFILVLLAATLVILKDLL